MGRDAGALLTWFQARDRRPFLWPAVAATLLHPLFWVMLLGTDPKGYTGRFGGFGGLRALHAFAEILLIAAILPALGWAFASRGVFAVLALGGVFAWVPWAFFVGFVVITGPAVWLGLPAVDRVTGVVLAVQVLLWPICFVLVFRAAMGGARR
ncbi:hypothetical protein [Falsiroseomonas sp.]|uniref:hypothetical protein n=1 Tax=Falsiroseomonas sp. TaxID=2870721 RepID=UPI0035654F84